MAASIEIIKQVSEEDLVPREWSRHLKDGDDQETVEEWGNRQWQIGLKTGRENGIAEAAKYLMDLATKKFAEKRGGISGGYHDEEAKMLRQLSEELTTLSKKS